MSISIERSSKCFCVVKICVKSLVRISQFFKLRSGKLSSSLQQNSDNWRSWLEIPVSHLCYDQELIKDWGKCILNSKSLRMVKGTRID